MARNGDSSNTECIDLGNNSALDIASSGDITSVVWVKTTDTYSAVISFRSSTSSNPIFNIHFGYNGITNSSGKPMCIWRGDSGTYLQKAAAATKNDDVWHALSFVKSGGATIEFWVDSASEGTSTGSLTAATTCDYNFLFQERRWTQDSTSSLDDRWFEGDMAFVGIWNGLKLFDNAIKAIGRGIPPFVFRDSNMKVDMPLWGNDSPEPDTTSNSIDGTLTGTRKATTNPPV